jgi:hypothetical protein
MRLNFKRENKNRKIQNTKQKLKVRRGLVSSLSVGLHVIAYKNYTHLFHQVNLKEISTLKIHANSTTKKTKKILLYTLFDFCFYSIVVFVKRVVVVDLCDTIAVLLARVSAGLLYTQEDLRITTKA